jgi:hypothetical protein
MDKLSGNSEHPSCYGYDLDTHVDPEINARDKAALRQDMSERPRRSICNAFKQDFTSSNLESHSKYNRKGSRLVPSGTL